MVLVHLLPQAGSQRPAAGPLRPTNNFLTVGHSRIVSFDVCFFPLPQPDCETLDLLLSSPTPSVCPPRRPESIIMWRPGETGVSFSQMWTPVPVIGALLLMERYAVFATFCSYTHTHKNTSVPPPLGKDGRSRQHQNLSNNNSNSKRNSNSLYIMKSEWRYTYSLFFF